MERYYAESNRRTIWQYFDDVSDYTTGYERGFKVSTIGPLLWSLANS